MLTCSVCECSNNYKVLCLSTPPRTSELHIENPELLEPRRVIVLFIPNPISYLRNSSHRELPERLILHYQHPCTRVDYLAMDGTTIAASLLRIGTAGRQLAITLSILATQLATDAEDRISALSNDVSFTASVLQQLGEPIKQNIVGDGGRTGIVLSQRGLETTGTAVSACECIFNEIERAVRDASERIRGRRGRRLGKIKLSGAERAGWPLLQPSIEALRNELRGARGTLMLMLQVTSLALSSKKMVDR